jgi:ATP-dependent DNA helicase RecQ
MKTDRRQVRRIMREKFGFVDFRPGQEAAIKSVLEGHDTLAVLPTGLGKSLIYQMAEQVLHGPTVVISPLIALQRDQVESIEESNVGKAALVNSTMREAEREEVLQELEQGKLNYLFLAPEQFSNEEVLQQIKEAHPALFVIDEAHCISEWGHDFRPEYLRLGAIIEALGRPPILALTATAAPTVREEILERLGMREPCVIVQGFDRPNIWLSVEIFREEHDKKKALIERVVAAEKPGIVYTATRKHAEEIAEALREQHIQAAFYHAGMRSVEREQVQEQFMGDEIDVIIATTAFGMGIDKPNVRFVFHYDISDSVDSYYQEIGRAGRDGNDAKAILFYRPEDMRIHRFFAGSGHIDIDQVEQVAQVVQGSEEPVVLQNLSDKTHLSKSKLAEALSRLEEAGVVKTLASGEIVTGDGKVALEEAVIQVVNEHQARRQYDKSRIDMMVGYAEVQDCRREYLLNYFGEEIEDPCGFCDNCDAGITVAEDEENMPFPINTKVMHNVWNVGLVLRYEGDKMVVLFDSVGYKTLAVDVVVEHSLLMPV